MPAPLTPTSGGHCHVGQLEGPGPARGQLGAGPDDGPSRCWELTLQFEAGERTDLLLGKVVSSGCRDRGRRAARPGRVGARPPGPPRAPTLTPPRAPDRTAPAAPSVHAGPLETQGSGPAAIRLQPACSPRTDGQGCWGSRGPKQRTAQNARLERRQAAESRAGPGPGPQGSPPNPQ